MPERHARALARRKAIILVAGLLLSAVAAVVINRLIDSQLVDDAEASVDRRVDTVRRELDRAVSHVRGLAAFVATNPRLTRADFYDFVSRFGRPHAVVSSQWLPVVAGPDRAAFEARARRSGIRDFAIRDHDAQGTPVPAGRRERYVPVLFAEPSSDGAAPVGIDAQHNPVAAQAMQRALDSGRPAATGLFTGPGETATDNTIAIFVAVRAGEAVPAPPVIGFARGIVHLADIFANAAPDQARILAADDTSDAAHGQRLFAAAGAARPDITYVRNIEVAGRSWTLVFAPPPTVTRDWVAILVYGLGVVLTLVAVMSIDKAVQQVHLERLGAEVSQQRETLRERENVYFALFENAGTANCEIDLETGRFLRVNESMCQLFGYTREELLQKTFLEVTLPEDRDVTDSPVERLLSGELDTVMLEKRYIKKSGEVFWGFVTSRAFPDLRGVHRNATSVIQDITARKNADSARDMLVRELAHRVRNTMQLVASLADQSAKSAHTVEEYRAGFQGRLRALTAAQDVLFDTSWQSVGLVELVEKTLMPFHERLGSERLSISCDSARLTPQQSQTIALALHELATNSVRHGALSAPGGRVELNIRRVASVGENGSDRLDLAWTESGGPAVAPPERTGFGLIMLQKLLALQHGGHTSLDWRESGLMFSATLPLRSDHIS